MQSSEFKDIILKNSEEAISELFALEDLKIGYFTQKSLHKTTGDNEDSLFISHKGSKLRLGVADGAGGHPRGKDASALAIEAMSVIDDRSILQKIEQANDSILALKAGAKTTLSFVEFDGNKVSFHSVGDSEIVYWNGVARELYSSVPHSPAGLKVEAGVFTQEESLVDPERHIVISLLGDEFVKIQSTSSFELKKGHIILIGSDGLFDNISHQQLNEIISSSSFEDSFDKISHLCKEQNNWLKDDDIVFILIKKFKA